MKHGVLGHGIRKLRYDWAGSKIPVVTGLLIMSLGVVSAIWGCTIVTHGAHVDAQNTLYGMSLIGGLYLLLTGLWFMTRSGVNWRRLVGLAFMLSGILLGTWWGIIIVVQNEDGQFAGANAVFIGGLLIHLFGILYAKNE